MSFFRWRVGSLLFVSGMCSLIYETVWVRELRLVFGASTLASGAVLACFMGGIGVGALLLGKRADRPGRMPRTLGTLPALQWYAFLEAIIAVSAAATPLLLWVVRATYIALGGSRTLGLGGGTAVRLVLSAVVFAAPTVAMGGTLPAAARAIARGGDPARRSVGLLYGMNALGGVLGCLLATFVLFETCGTRMTLWLACGANLVIAWVAFRLRAPAGPSDAGAAEAVRTPCPTGDRVALRALLLTAAATTGFVFCLLELVWYRMLGPLLGGSVFTFGLILAVALAGVALGSSVYGASSRARGVTLLAFAWTCSMEALVVATPRAWGDGIAVLSAILRPVAALGFAMQVAEWALITSLVVLPAAVLAGAQFPLLIGLLGRGDDGVGRDVGDAYACNTGGAIVGSLVGGFGLIPALGADACWRLGGGLLASLGLTALAVAVVNQKRSLWTALPVALVSVVTFAAIGAAGPTAAFRHSPIGAGLVDPDRLRTPNDIQSWLLERRRAVDWQVDGIEASLGIESSSGVSFVVNGKNDGNARGDAATTVLLGLLGAYVHPHPRRAMVIGLGTGASAGWLAAVPSITDVDVGELEPAVLEVARRSAPVNHGALENPKVHIALGDARETLLTSNTKYDLIASEPSNPYREGVASLFTLEFYQAVARALEPDGIFLQWVQGYAVDSQTVRTVYATLAEAFPVVETFHLKSDDLLLVASAHAVDFDVPRLRTRMNEEPFRSAFALAWRTTDLEGVLAHYVAGPDTGMRIAKAEAGVINSDDVNRVEFGFARCLTGNADFNINDVRAIARAHRDDMPRVHGGNVDWSHAEEQALTLVADEGLVTSTGEANSSPQRAHRIAALNAFVQGDLQQTLLQWRAQPQEPLGPTEWAVVATAVADSGSEAAGPLIDRMREFNSAEADVTLARLRFRQGRIDDAMRALEAGYAAYREDPWPLPSLMLRALAFSVEVVSRYPAMAERMWIALRQPFSLRLADEVRKKVAAYAAKLIILPDGQSRDGLPAHGRRPCVEANEAFEPNPVWTDEFLVSRAQCYEAAQHPLAARAKSDVNEFRRAAPGRFSDGLL